MVSCQTAKVDEIPENYLAVCPIYIYIFFFKFAGHMCTSQHGGAPTEESGDEGVSVLSQKINKIK